MRKPVKMIAWAGMLALLAAVALNLASRTPQIDAAGSGQNLELIKSADKQVVEADNGDKFVTYTLTAKNNAKCDAPFNTMLVFDRSGSMDDDSQNPPEPISTSRTAAGAFIDTLNFKKDTVGLVSYASTARVETGLGVDGPYIKQKMNEMKADGYTNISAALENAISQLPAGTVNPVIILLSDGVANRPEPEASAPGAAIAVASKAKASGIRVVTIGLGQESDPATLQAIASPGYYYYSPSKDQLHKIFTDLAKSFQGVSPDTVIKDDLSYILDDADFVSATDGGVFDGKIVSWQIGDLLCGEERTVQVTVKVKSDPATPGIHTNQGVVSSPTEKPVTSNPVDVLIKAPNLTVAVTDNRTIAVPGDKVCYVITVGNNGDGKATDVTLINQIPEFLDQDSVTISVGGVEIGKNLAQWKFDMEAGEIKEFTVCATVRADIPDGYTTVIDIATLINDGVTKKAQDQTQIYRLTAPQPNFTIFADCQEQRDDTTIVRFSYTNNNAVAQELTSSTTDPATDGVAPRNLLPGKHRRVFAVATNTGSATWSATAVDVQHTATNSAETPDCNALVEEVITPIPEYPLERTFIGTPIVNKPASPSPNFPPTVKLDQVNPPASCELPRIEVPLCSAIDSDGSVTALQYSLNNGRTWYPISNTAGLGTANASCSFVTVNLADGNYKLKARALDNNGNVGMSATQDVNVNCEGIVIGSTQFNQNEVLAPINERGMVNAQANEVVHMAIAINGGPSEAAVFASKGENDAEIKTKFDLVYNEELELWETDLQFTEGGVYELLVVAKEADGAETSRFTNSVQVNESFQVVNVDSEQITDANLQVYYRQSNNQRWAVWDGATYNRAGVNEEFTKGLILEPGHYYFQLGADGYFTTTTREFVVTEYSIVSSKLTLYRNSDILNIFNTINQSVELKPIEKSLIKDLQAMLDERLPQIALERDAKTITTDDLVANQRPFVIVTWTDWGTLSAGQWQHIHDLVNMSAEERGFDVYPVGLLEGLEENKAITVRGRYDFPIYKPADLSFFDTMQVISAPQYFFVDANGTLREVLVGDMFPAQVVEVMRRSLIVNTNSDN